MKQDKSAPSFSSSSPIRAEELTRTGTNTHARSAILFVSILGRFNKSHLSFQALALPGLLAAACAPREFKPSDPHSEQVAFFLFFFIRRRS